MHIRQIKRTNKSGKVRVYTQIMQSFRDDKGKPTNRVVAHLGRVDDIFVENLRRALAASRSNALVAIPDGARAALSLTIQNDQSLEYLPLAVLSRVFREAGLRDLLLELCGQPARAASTADLVEALVLQRCLKPDSKLQLQQWLPQTAAEEVLGLPNSKLNNTRVHRGLDELHRVEPELQPRMASLALKYGETRVLYLDLTDTWFEAGGGSKARKAKTKEGIAKKLKINIALLVNEMGLPLRWEVLPGALCETKVLPAWLERLEGWEQVRSSVLIFDRGMPSWANFQRLLDPKQGHLFLTSVKSDAIPTYLKVDREALDALQTLDVDAPADEVAQACAPLGLAPLRCDAYAKDLGVVEAPEPPGRGQRPPAMRLYLYFNPAIRETKRHNRAERIRTVERFVEDLNTRLRSARKSRRAEVIRRKVASQLQRLRLLELYHVHLDPHPVPGKTRIFESFQVRLELRPKVLAHMRRFDGLSLLVGHPHLTYTVEEAIDAYRAKNAVEADFRTIKSVLKLRPVHHRTDLKIEAHVTTCVLALLIERLIELRLKQAPRSLNAPKTAKALLEELNPIRLNRLRCLNQAHYTRVTESNRIRRLLRALGMEDLLEVYDHELKITLPAP